MLDHIFLSVSDVERLVVFYTAVLATHGVTKRGEDEGKTDHLDIAT